MKLEIKQTMHSWMLTDKFKIRPEIKKWLKENYPRKHKIVGDYYIAFETETDKMTFLLYWR